MLPDLKMGRVRLERIIHRKVICNVLVGEKDLSILAVLFENLLWIGS